MLTEVKQCFSVPIIVGSINVDNKALLELITKHRDNRVLMDHSDPNYEDTYLPPHRLIDSVIREVLQDLRGIGEDNLDCTSFWSHIHEKNMSTNWHDHGGYYAGVYYVSVPEGSGDIIFDRQHQPSVSISPVEGQYIIFPAWLKHAVARNNSESLRISLSFNLERTP